MNARRRRMRAHAHAETAGLAAPEINTTPLIDVMLVLLIMLIITIPVRLDAVDMSTPPPSPHPPSHPPVVVKLLVGPGDSVSWDGQPVASQARLEQLMQQAAQATPPVELQVQPSPQARYDTFARVLATAQREGVRSMGLVEGRTP